MSNLDKLAKSFGLEEDRDYRIEHGKIFIAEIDEYGRRSFHFYGNKIAYRDDYVEMFRDIKRELDY